MPLQRRLPKFGFKNINRVQYKAINLDLISQFAEARQLTAVGIEELRRGRLRTPRPTRKSFGQR